MENNPYPNTAIETEDVWRVYKTGSLEVAALKGVNLQITQGTFAALKGRSGSGKTTPPQLYRRPGFADRWEDPHFRRGDSLLERAPADALAP